MLLATPAENPLIPLYRCLPLKEFIALLLDAIAREIAKLGRPPRGVGRGFHQGFDLCRALVRRCVNQELFDFFWGRQGSSKVKAYSP